MAAVAIAAFTIDTSAAQIEMAAFNVDVVQHVMDFPIEHSLEGNRPLPAPEIQMSISRMSELAVEHARDGGAPVSCTLFLTHSAPYGHTFAVRSRLVGEEKEKKEAFLSALLFF